MVDQRLPGAPDHGAEWKERRRSSRFLHRVGELVGHAVSGTLAGTFVVIWLIVGIKYGFPGWWSTVLAGVSAAVTFVMVFVIQHTQSRQTAATQRKLDELIRASTRADDALIGVEEAADDHLQRLTASTIAEREAN